MQQLVLIFLLFFSIHAKTQELKFEDVVKVDSTITKAELFNRARTWFGNTYKSEKDVISISDRNEGEISGNGSIRYDPRAFYFGADCARGYVMYKINIFVKDGKYKYKFHSFVHEGTRCSGGGGLVSYGLLTDDSEPGRGSKKGWNEVKDLVISRLDKLIESLKLAMNKKYEGSEDW